MLGETTLLSFVLFLAVLPVSRSFTTLQPPFRPLLNKSAQSSTLSRSSPRFATPSPLDELDDDRKAALFQFLLRDLQVEGVPLLEVEAPPDNQVLQAVLWTTMAELSEQATGQKACLVFEQFSVETLQTLVDYFGTVKAQTRIMTELSQLDRFQISLVGKGVGPAVLIETSNSTDQVTIQQPSAEAEHQAQTSSNAMMAFIESSDTNVETLPIAYRATPPGCDTCQIMMAFWNLICEMMATNREDLGSAVLTLPLSSSDEEQDASTTVSRFEAITELLKGSLGLFGFDNDLELNSFHPGNDSDASHRSAPVPAVWIKRKAS